MSYPFDVVVAADDEADQTFKRVLEQSSASRELLADFSKVFRLSLRPLFIAFLNRSMWISQVFS